MTLDLQRLDAANVSHRYNLTDVLEQYIDAPMLLIDAQLLILHMNAAAVRWCEMPAPPRPPTHLSDILPQRIAHEREQAVREALQTGIDILLDGVMHGEGSRTIVHRLQPKDDSGLDAVMILLPLATIEWSPDQEQCPAVIARHHDLGPLERLTPRELQVFAMITQGRTTSEVAENLHRSRRTIDCHRAAISHKLDGMGLPELTVLALQAGLIRCGRRLDPTRGDELYVNHPLLSRLIKHRNGAAGRAAEDRYHRTA